VPVAKGTATRGGEVRNIEGANIIDSNFLLKIGIQAIMTFMKSADRDQLSVKKSDDARREKFSLLTPGTH
jgi:hypothetical protein